METHVEKELQILKSDYNLLKAELKQQKTLNETFLKSLRKRPATAVNKEIKNRMWGDIITIPMISIICANIHWPMLFGFLVSLWALADLCASLWIYQKLDMRNLLNDDVQSVTKKITAYRKFYTRSLTAGLIPLVAMITYIFITLYARASSPTAIWLITAAGIISTATGIVITLLYYKKHVERCNELLHQFDADTLLHHEKN